MISVERGWDSTWQEAWAECKQGLFICLYLDFIMENYIARGDEDSIIWCQKVCCKVLNKSSSCCMMSSQVFFCLRSTKFFLWTADFIATHQTLSSCLLHLQSVSAIKDLNYFLFCESHYGSSVSWRHAYCGKQNCKENFFQGSHHNCLGTI